VHWTNEEVGAEDGEADGLATPGGSGSGKLSINKMRSAYTALKDANCDPQLIAHAAADLEAAE